MPRRIAAIRPIAELHVFEPHLACRAVDSARQRRSVRTIGDLALHLEQAEHLLHIHQALLDRHVDHAEEAQWLIKLHQIGVDQHELPDGHRAAAHLACRHQHDQREAESDDEGLADVQQVQRHLHAHRGAFVARERRVVARHLVRLVAEILHRLVVQQAVERLGAGVVVGVVHRAADARAPGGEAHGEAGVAHHRGKRDRGEAPVEQAPDDRGDQQQLDHRRHHVEHRETQHRLDALRAAIDRTGQRTGLAVEMKAQAERVQMLEGAPRGGADGALLHLGEQRIAQLAERGGADAQQAVADHQPQRDGEQGRVVLRRQRIDDAAVDHRHSDGRELGEQQQAHRENDAGPGAGVALGPEIRQQRANRRHAGTLVRGRLREAASAGRGSSHYRHVAWRWPV